MAEKIAHNIYRITMPTPFEVEPVNVYLFAGEVPTLLDTGINSPEALIHLEKNLREIGYDLVDIRQILLTHGHVDHYGLAEKICQVSGAVVLLHPTEWKNILELQETSSDLAEQLDKQLELWGVPESFRKDIQGIKLQMRKYGKLSATNIIPVEDGLSVRAGDYKLLAIHCPGHSPGLLVWYLQEKEILFSGDHVLLRITPNPDLYLPARNGFWSGLPDYLDSLGKVSRLEVRACFPGHGQPINDFRQRVKQIYRSHKARERRMASLFKGDSLTVYELTLRFLADINKVPTVFTFFLGLRETLGHLALLERCGKLRQKTVEGRILFTVERGGMSSKTFNRCCN